MDSGQTDWVGHALDWAWAVIVGAVTVLGGAIVRLWRHEERIKSLEKIASDRTSAWNALTEKVDRNHEATTNRIDDLGRGIRDDLRIIMSRCLTINHGE